MLYWYVGKGKHHNKGRAWFTYPVRDVLCINFFEIVYWNFCLAIAGKGACGVLLVSLIVLGIELFKVSTMLG